MSHVMRTEVFHESFMRTKVFHEFVCHEDIVVS